MSFAWFLVLRHPGRLADADRDRFTAIVRATPALRRALIHTPATTHDPYLDDGVPPALVAELHFDELPALEAALAPGGHLQGLAAPGVAPSIAGAQGSQQAMLVRRFAVPEPGPRPAPGDTRCTYLVSYDGPADDLNAWLWHYIAHHPPIMAKFPGIREIEICSRVDWCGFLPWPRASCMQRNKVVFDDPAALTAALNSPVRDEMRRDFADFPKFTGAVLHFPMLTREHQAQEAKR